MDESPGAAVPAHRAGLGISRSSAAIGTKCSNTFLIDFLEITMETVALVVVNGLRPSPPWRLSKMLGFQEVPAGLKNISTDLRLVLQTVLPREEKRKQEELRNELRY